MWYSAGMSGGATDSAVRAVSNELRAELTQIRQLQAENLRARDDTRTTEALIRELINEQVKSQQVRTKNREFIKKWVLGPLATLLAGAAGLLGYVQSNKPDPTVAEGVEQARETEAMENAVSTPMVELERKQALTDTKIDRIVEIQLDQQVQLSETTDYIVDKIDHISPRARSVQEPESVQEGRAKANAIKAAREGGKVGYDPANPLGDLTE